MKQIRDAIVIGAGIIGCATAFGLARAGIRRVTLIDKGPLASGMTRRNPGLVHPFHSAPVFSGLAKEAHDFYSQWGVHLRGKTAYTETGAAVVTNLQSGEALQQWRMLSGAQETTPDDLAALFPSLTGEWRSSLYTPFAGYADPVLTAQAFVNAARERGLEVQTGTQVRQIVIDQRRVKGVKTTTGDIEAPIVVAAAGSWTDKLLLPLGFGLRLRFRRGAVLFYEQPASISGDLPILVDADGTNFFRPHPYRMGAAGRVADEAHLQGAEMLDESVSHTETTSVNRFISACIPAFAHAPAKRMHSILYSAPADGLAALGKVPHLEGLYVAAGFGTSAFSVAPAAGEALAQIVIDGRAATDLSSFDPARPGLRA
jgi:glycine/D-amino acid oxidase-like deaminating enzyme